MLGGVGGSIFQVNQNHVSFFSVSGRHTSWKLQKQYVFYRHMMHQLVTVLIYVESAFQERCVLFVVSYLFQYH